MPRAPCDDPHTLPPSCVAGCAQMSKHSMEHDKGDFWKKMRYGATAAVAVGTGVYAVTTAVRKQG